MIKDLTKDAADAHKVGLMSYSKYTQALTKSVRHIKSSYQERRTQTVIVNSD